MPTPARTTPARRCSTTKLRSTTLAGRRPARASVSTGGTATGELDIFIISGTFFVSWMRGASRASDVPRRRRHRRACILLDGGQQCSDRRRVHDDEQTGSPGGRSRVSRARVGPDAGPGARASPTRVACRRRKRPGSPPCLSLSLSLSLNPTPLASTCSGENAPERHRASSVSAPAICWRSACRGWTTCRGCARASIRPA